MQRFIDNGIVESMVAAGHGIAILPRYTTRDHENGLVTRRSSGVRSERVIWAIQRPEVAVRPSVRLVIEALRDEAEHFVAQHTLSASDRLHQPREQLGQQPLGDRRGQRLDEREQRREPVGQRRPSEPVATRCRTPAAAPTRSRSREPPLERRQRRRAVRRRIDVRLAAHRVGRRDQRRHAARAAPPRSPG